MASEAEWQVLARLFAGEDTPFRHQLSLSKSNAADFYAATAEASSLREAKQTILQSARSAQYLCAGAEGLPLFQGFAGTVGYEFEPGLSLDELNRAATLALEPDFVLLAPEDWRLVWASVCFPTRWSLAGKARQPLPHIHAIVPGLNEDLGRKIGVFFAKLAPGDDWARANWGLSTSAERNQHPSLPYTPLSCQTPLESIYVRLESQHLQKLPRTGGIAFGIRILNFRLLEVCEHRAVVAGLKERLRTMPAAVSAYKGIPTDLWQRL